MTVSVEVSLIESFYDELVKQARNEQCSVQHLLLRGVYAYVSRQSKRALVIQEGAAFL